MRIPVFKISYSGSDVARRVFNVRKVRAQDGITQLLRSYFEEMSFAILIIKEHAKKHALNATPLCAAPFSTHQFFGKIQGGSVP